MPEDGSASAFFDSLACTTLRDWPATRTLPAGSMRRLLRGDDSCVLELIDSVLELAVGEDRGIAYLRMIADSSDGYVGEYMEDVGAGLFHRSGRRFLDYLSRASGSGGLRWFLLLGLREELGSAKDRAQAEKELRESFQREEVGMSVRGKRFSEQVLHEALAKEPPEPPK